MDRVIEEDAANNGGTHIRKIGDSMHAAQCGGTALDAVVCRAECELCVCRAEGEEVAANNWETHNSGDIDDSMHAAQCSGTAFDAVVCRTDIEYSVSAGQHYGEEATANREITLLQASQQPVQISNEYFELEEFVNLHETEENPLVQIVMHDPHVQNGCKRLDNLLTELIFDLAKEFLRANRQTLNDLCEGLPSPSWHRRLVQISLTIARLALPRRSIFSRCIFSILQTNVNHLVADFCSQFKTNFSRAEYEAFFCFPI